MCAPFNKGSRVIWSSCISCSYKYMSFCSKNVPKGIFCLLNLKNLTEARMFKEFYLNGSLE